MRRMMNKKTRKTTMTLMIMLTMLLRALPLLEGEEELLQPLLLLFLLL
jgi:hypothetical protein